MSSSIRIALVAVLLVVIPTLLAFAWGLSWALGDFPDCATGTYFLADAEWLFQGVLLGLGVGITVPIVLAVQRSFVLAFPVIIAAGIGMFLAGGVGADMAPPLVDCTAFSTRGAAQAIVLGVVLGAVPTLLVAAIVVWLGRSRS